MKKLAMGAAVTAVMACGMGGSATSAKADPIVIDFTINNSGLMFYGTGVGPGDFPTSGSVTISLYQGGFFAVVDSLSLSLGSNVISEKQFDTVDAVAYYPTGTRPFYFAGFDLVDQYQRDNSGTIDLDLTGKGYSDFFYSTKEFFVSCNDCVTTTLVSGTLPTFVPLPDAAPMFGAALIGLAGVGYAAQRKRAA